MRPLTVYKAQNPFREALFWQQGLTHLYVTCSLEPTLPPFLKGSSLGWIHIEYALAPGSTPERGERERKGASGRTLEIQRFLGRVFRSMAQLDLIKDHTLRLDVEVLSADGSTRAAGMNAAFFLAQSFFKKKNLSFFKEDFCALSLGYNNQRDFLIDLTYEQDSEALVDFNIAMTKSGRLIEVQGCGEKTQLDLEEFTQMLKKAQIESKKIFDFYEQHLSSFS